NIELITDRPLDDNFREIADVKKRYPKHAVIVSLMAETKDQWRELIQRSEDAGGDGLELNFGCPHGMCERGMGSAVGQEPQVLEELVHWVVDMANLPVISKLTPNITDIREPAMAAKRAGSHAVSLINTIQSLMGVDLDRLSPRPVVDDASSHGGYCGPAVKPIALRMVAQLAREHGFDLPISGIGGISNWRDAAEFLALGARSVQVCTAVMHYGYRIVDDMIEGLDQYLADKGMASVDELVGAAIPAFKEWGELDLNYHVVAEIDADRCIGCDLCHVACHDGAHQCIHLPGTAAIPGHTAPMAKVAARLAETTASDPIPYRVPWVDETECVGCNLCQLVCPVAGCISMVEKRRAPAKDTWNQRVADGRDHVPGGLGGV
ncbi:MAG: NAD-dependent dihydropyrimidine dehydrogenase subunit PreA, partial [Planctomycetes bacterium]|nr:NAD-dependent dihydropyrimidine dehydrogenase subunit PreA [Planctomycetota bacterium]